MIKPIDMMPGLMPTREEQIQPDGSVRITVTPPKITGFSPSSITLTADQYRRYRQWRDTGVLIQEALPDLSAGQREILITGIGEEEFDEAFRDED